MRVRHTTITTTASSRNSSGPRLLVLQLSPAPTNPLYWVALAGLPACLLLLSLLLWLFIRSRLGRSAPTPAQSKGQRYHEVAVEEEDQAGPVKGRAPLRQSLPALNLNISTDSGASSCHSLSEVHSSRSNSPQCRSADRLTAGLAALPATRHRWQSDGKRTGGRARARHSVCVDRLTQYKWRSEDWEKDTKFMTLIARRLELGNSNAEITEL